ncbi:MAG: hypothetical protein ACK4FW_03250 [Stenotrophomonas sp.]
MDDHRTASAIQSIWWQVALGGFLALTAHSLVEGAYAHYEARRAMAQLESEFAPLYRRKYADSAVPQEVRAAPLRANERCIQGRRFERVENGWKQVNERCSE